MRVVVAGGHGQIAMLLHPLLVERGDAVRALIRKPDHAEDVRRAGAEPVRCDLEVEPEDSVAAAVGEADAVVFAAGAGPGSGAERKRTMDYGGAVKLIAAARANAIDRYAMVSAMGATAPPPPSEGGVFGEYLRAKADADAALMASGLAWTVVRPGGLTNDPGTGRVRVGAALESGSIPRADVAAVLAEVLHADNTIGKAFDVVSGPTPIPEAITSL